MATTPAASILLLRGGRYAEAADAAEAELRGADSLVQAATPILREHTAGRTMQELAEAIVFFRRVHQVLAELGDLRLAINAAENLAGVLGGFDHSVGEAIELREQVWRYVHAHYAPDDDVSLRTREGLAFLYTRAGRAQDAAALFAETGICDHLQPLLSSVLAAGAHIVSVGRPWSRNCHIWVYVNRKLDTTALLRQAPEYVTLHEHRGTHDGSERGLVCERHQDGLMGPY